MEPFSGVRFHICLLFVAGSKAKQSLSAPSPIFTSDARSTAAAAAAVATAAPKKAPAWMSPVRAASFNERRASHNSSSDTQRPRRPPSAAAAAGPEETPHAEQKEQLEQQQYKRLRINALHDTVDEVEVARVQLATQIASGALDERSRFCGFKSRWMRLRCRIWCSPCASCAR